MALILMVPGARQEAWVGLRHNPTHCLAPHSVGLRAPVGTLDSGHDAMVGTSDVVTTMRPLVVHVRFWQNIRVGHARWKSGTSQGVRVELVFADELDILATCWRAWVLAHG
jgi:hypothetical protein